MKNVASASSVKPNTQDAYATLACAFDDWNRQDAYVTLAAAFVQALPQLLPN